MHESEGSEQISDGEELRESVDEGEAPAADGRSSAEDIARDLKEKEEQAEDADG